jgi:membrane protease YdiL (CAAX protease family)
MSGEDAVPVPQRGEHAFPTTFVVVAFGFTWTCWWLAALDERGLISLPVPLVLLGSFGPLVAALSVTARDGGRAALRALLGRVVRWRVPPTWYAVALLGPVVMYLAAVVLHVLAGGRPPDVTALVRTLPAAAVATVYFVVVAGLGEEVGWRGYALPALQARYSALLSSTILGVLWALWHLPLFFTPSVGSYGVLPFPLYLAYMIPFTILVTWVFNSAYGSVLIAMILHGTINASGELLKAVPEYAVRPATVAEAAALTGRIYLLLTVAMAVAATVVVLVHGPRDLSRRPREVPEAAGDRPPADRTSRPLGVEPGAAKAGPHGADDDRSR